jgi:4-hydroxy-tetrahydrodipicolinate synthase
MNNHTYLGTGVALITPFHKDGSIDFASLEKLVEHVSVGNVDYLVVNGTTAESPTLDIEEKHSLVLAVKKYNKRNLPIVYGAGANDTRELLAYFKNDIFKEVDAVLSVTPYYNRPSQKGLLHHYQAAADNCPKPIILYNVPSRTAVNLQASTALQLALHPNIIGIKEACSDFIQIGELLQQQHDDFSVISGDDFITLPMMAIGAKGAISVVANAFPSTFSQMVNAALKGNFIDARVHHAHLLKYNQALYFEGNPAGLKCILSQIGIAEENLRLPLVAVSDELRAQVVQLLASEK